MKVKQLANNQITYIDKELNGTYFQSYDSVIALVINKGGIFEKTLLSEHYDYSKTTMKYLCKFLGLDSISQVRNRLKSGKYSLNIDTDGNLLHDN